VKIRDDDLDVHRQESLEGMLAVTGHVDPVPSHLLNYRTYLSFGKRPLSMSTVTTLVAGVRPGAFSLVVSTRR